MSTRAYTSMASMSDPGDSALTDLTWSMRLADLLPRAGQFSRGTPEFPMKGTTMADEKNETPEVDESKVEQAPEAKPEPKVKTIDSHEASVGWTIQQGGKPADPQGVPGSVVTAAELPDKASLEAAGVDLDQYFGTLVIAADEDEKAAIRDGK